MTENPKCPRCDGPTRLRRGKWGEFYGCQKYPSCTGTVQPEKPPEKKGREAPCKFCGHPVIWADSLDHGGPRRVPLDPGITVYVIVSEEAKGEITVRTTAGALASHFGTCPNKNGGGKD